MDMKMQLKKKIRNLTQNSYVEAIFLNIACIIALRIFIGCQALATTGYDLSPDSTQSTIFNEIYDQDSTVHWYEKIVTGDVYCYYHDQMEKLIINAK
tara:strand:+ start:539 stop:829 length:291 start_codon:yes stop_codon:yes gene_type:complete